MKSFLKTASRAVAALFAVVLVTVGVASPAFADDVTEPITTGSITIERDGKPTGVTYDDLVTATPEAKSGDTIKLGEGNYTLYKVNSEGHTKGKDLTFEGLGTDKTAWNIGAEVPNPDNFGTEYNGDYSFDGAGTVTFKNMTMRSGSADYLGFIRANNTVVDGCVINGKTFYWGYESAEFKNTTFNAPNGDYAIWTYSSPTMTFDSCTFNASGKVINVYTDYGAGSHDIYVNVNKCTFNSNDSKGKQALNINDSNMGSFKYIIKFKGANTATAGRDIKTCSQLFGFGGKSTYNSGHSDVYFDDELVWTLGAMKTHSYTDGQHEDYFVDQNDYVWTQEDGDWYCTGHAKCGYCGYKIAETVKATVETTPATCTEAGKTSYTANFTHKCFKPQVNSEESPALNHDWDTPKYSWAKQDDGWYCTAERVCKRDASHVEQETVKATVEHVIDATCETAGKDVYTAAFENEAFEAQKRTVALGVLGHDWGEPEYSWNEKSGNWYCTAKRVCKRDASHVEEETVKAAYKVTTPATTEKEGEGTYTATFENEAFETQTKAESIDKLPVKPQKPAKPKDDKPSKTDKTNKQTLPGTGDFTANVIMAMLSMTAICFAGSAIASKMRK